MLTPKEVFMTALELIAQARANIATRLIVPAEDKLFLAREAGNYEQLADLLEKLIIALEDEGTLADDRVNTVRVMLDLPEWY